MGTNYYAKTDTCDHCGRSEEKVHIGKSSAGWSFSFRGYADREPRPIVSFTDWLEFLEGPKIKIVDEYGSDCSLEAFVELVEQKRSERLNHTTFCRKNHPDHALRDCWLDPQGHSFTGSTFS